MISIEEQISALEYDITLLKLQLENLRNNVNEPEQYYCLICGTPISYEEDETCSDVCTTSLQIEIDRASDDDDV